MMLLMLKRETNALHPCHLAASQVGANATAASAAAAASRMKGAKEEEEEEEEEEEAQTRYRIVLSLASRATLSKSTERLYHRDRRVDNKRMAKKSKTVDAWLSSGVATMQEKYENITGSRVTGEGASSRDRVEGEKTVPRMRARCTRASDGCMTPLDMAVTSP